jgi:2-polyprenyl-6-methoxyphenol hydroxylase-like FAD-dependent oxidoreductase
MKVAIAGGGIGGLTLALALHNAGIEDVDIYESAPEFRELGVGINVLPHAVRELDELGLLSGMAETGIPTAELTYYTKTGQRIWNEPRGMKAGYRWPQFSIHRGELLGLLYRTVLKRLGPSHMHAGHHLLRAGEEKSCVWAEFMNRGGNSAIPRVEADVLVGCDGIHSAARQMVHPGEGAPKWNGITMWRGLSEAKPFLSGRTMIMAGITRRRVVVYPVSRKHEQRGKALINWVAELKNADGRPMPRHDWNFVARPENVLPHFSSFKFDFLDVPALMQSAKVIYQYPMVDRDPVNTWNKGRITLLGDAAHPMYPIGSNGASQAILDARVLARELALQPTVEEALAAYDAQRRPATAKIVEANRKAGPEICMEIVEERAPDGFSSLDEIISQAELQEISKKYKVAAGFDIDTLNSRPSLSVPHSKSA